MKYTEKIGFIVLLLMAVMGLWQVFDLIVEWQAANITIYKQIAFAGLLYAILMLLTWDTIKKLLYIEAVYLKLVKSKLLKPLNVNDTDGAKEIEQAIKTKMADDNLDIVKLRTDVERLKQMYYAVK